MSTPSVSPYGKQHGRPHSQHGFVDRSSVGRTFRSIGSFLALIFLAAGVYLLQEELTDPLRAEAVGLIAGAFVIALATMLTYFIFLPRSKFRDGSARRRVASGAQQRQSPMQPARVSRREVAETVTTGLQRGEAHQA